MAERQFVLRARVVLPVSCPPIENGAVRISGNRIVAVGRWRDLASDATRNTVDLGEVVLLPGLVNAHCHLDYTGMAGEFPPPQDFTDWIKLITTAKAAWTYSDFAESWLRGAKMLVQTGTTTVADIEAVPELLPEIWEATPLRVFSFLEMTGIKSRRDPRVIVQKTIAKIESLPAGRCRAWLSPHAPYSTVPELLRLSAHTARRHHWRLTTHVAESAPEFEMFMHARGRMFDWLLRNERDMSDCGRVSPVQHLERNGLLGENLLAVHANHLVPRDVQLLARHRTSVVHCPRSHAYFRHQPFPRRELADAAVNVCLGTDSLATVYKTRSQPIQLDLFEEMRVLAATDPALSPKTILEMVTINGARALGMAGQIGELSEKGFADIIVVPCNGTIADICDCILHHAGPVTGSLIDGQWAVPARLA
jgi:cytosine/adenosine deaminase-related metal-dependent hydrolase